MRLLITTDTVGGVWTFAQELAGGLLDQGCDVFLVSFGGLPSAEQQAAATALEACGRCQYIASDVPLEWMQTNSVAYAGAEPLLLDLCSSFQPDALLLSQFCFGALPVSLPKIVIAHSDVLSWAAAVGRAPLQEDLWLRQYRALVQNGLDGADLLVSPTAAALAAMNPFYNLPGKTVTVLNGRTLELQERSRPRQLRAVSAGRMWDPAKNLALLAATTSSMPIVVAGDMDENAGKTTGYHAIGKKSQSELMELFTESAVYICCSLYEPFGLAPLEAALCGCAILANDLPSLREVWGDAAHYFKDAESLGSLLNMFSQDELLLAEAQAKSLQRAKYHTNARMTGGYLRQIECLAANSVGEQTCAA